MAKKTESADRRRIIVAPMRYDRVVDSTEGKYTAVSLVSYHITKNLIIRIAKDPKLLGYCVENPLEVLRTAFPDYSVTRFNGYELFGSGDFEETTPGVGLSIRGVNHVFGIEGRVEKLLELDEVLRIKRDKLVSEEHARRIIEYLGAERHPLDSVSRTYHQVIHDKKQIIDVLRQYARQRR